MTCPDFVIDPRGRQGIGVNQPPGGIDYPFIKPSGDIRYLVADFYLSYDDLLDYGDSNIVLSPPFKLAWLYGIGCIAIAPPGWAPTPTHAADLVIQDYNGQTVFDSTLAAAFTSQAWNSVYQLYEWRATTGVCRLVVYTAWPPTNTPVAINYGTNISPDNGFLDTRVCYRMPKRVRSLSVLLDTITASAVEWVCGYNIDLVVGKTVSKPGGRVVTPITVNAAPGGGLGIVPGCDPPPLVIRTINGTPPNTNGTFLLGELPNKTNGPCYWVRQPTTLLSTSPRITIPTITISPESYQLQIGNDCKPCCDCADFVDLAQYMNRIRDQYMAIGQTVYQAQTTYNANVQRWNIVGGDGVGCLLDHPIRIAVRAQGCPFLDVVVQYVNQTTSAQTNVVLSISFDTAPTVSPPPTIVSGSTAKTDATSEGDCGTVQSTDPYTLVGSWPDYQADWVSVPAYASVNVQFRLWFPNGGLSGITPYTVGIMATGTIDSSPILQPGNGDAVATASVTLPCPTGG